MSGERCKNFLRDLDICKLKSIKVKIKRPNISEPDYPQPIYRGLDDPKSLTVHFKTESLRGIFDREDIIVNQEYFEEGISKIKKSRSRRDDRSISSDRMFDKESDRSKYKDLSARSKDNAKYNYRSRSRSGEKHRRDSPRYRRDRSRSPSYRKRSSSPKGISSKKDSLAREERSRSSSTNSPPVKRPGLYIPPKSDYLRYEKLKSERSNRSRSPVPSRGIKFDKEKRHRTASSERKRSKTPYGDHASSSKRQRSGYFGKSRSRSISPGKSRDRRRQRTISQSPERSRTRKESEGQRDYKFRDKSKNSRSRSPKIRSSRRSRTPRSSYSRARENHSRSPLRRSKEYNRRRSCSRSRHRDRITEDDIHFQQNMPPYIFKDGEYWIPAGPIAGPGYIPRGYLPPHILYPRGFHPPMIMPRIPMMQPYRPRIYRPRMQAVSSNITSTAICDSQTKSNCQKEEDEHSVKKCESEDNSKVLQPLIETSVTKESSVTISEVSIERGEIVEDC